MWCVSLYAKCFVDDGLVPKCLSWSYDVWWLGKTGDQGQSKEKRRHIHTHVKMKIHVCKHRSMLIPYSYHSTETWVAQQSKMTASYIANFMIEVEGPAGKYTWI